MKKQILNLAFVATIILGSIISGCSSEKKANSADSTLKDSATMSNPTADTSKKMDSTKMMDTSKIDTSKKM